MILFLLWTNLNLYDCRHFAVVLFAGPCCPMWGPHSTGLGRAGVGGAARPAETNAALRGTGRKER